MLLLGGENKRVEVAQRPRTASDPEGLVSEQEQAVAAARLLRAGSGSEDAARVWFGPSSAHSAAAPPLLAYSWGREFSGCYRKC